MIFVLFSLLTGFGADGTDHDFRAVAGLLSNQREKSISFHFIMVPLKKNVIKYGTPKPRLRGP